MLKSKKYICHMHLVHSENRQEEHGQAEFESTCHKQYVYSPQETVIRHVVVHARIGFCIKTVGITAVCEYAENVGSEKSVENNRRHIQHKHVRAHCHYGNLPVVSQGISAQSPQIFVRFRNNYVLLNHILLHIISPVLISSQYLFLL